MIRAATTTKKRKTSNVHLRAALLSATLTAGVTGTAWAKSVYVIADINAWPDIPINAYDIQPAPVYLDYQTTYSIPDRDGGAVGLAIDAEAEYVFVTFEFSNVIDLLDGITMTAVGDVTAPSASNLAGIVVDQGKQKVYTVDRNTNHLFVYSWDPGGPTLTLDGGTYVTLPGCNNGIYGIALDEVNELLYVGDSTTSVKYYDTNDWSSLGGELSVSHPARGIAIDVPNQYVYTASGGPDGGSLLSKYDVGEQTEATVDVGSTVLGVAVDQATELVYITTYGDGSNPDSLIVYDAALNQQWISGDIGNPTGVAVKEISFNLLDLSKNDGLAPDACVRAEDSITYTVCYDNELNPEHDVHNVTIVDTLPPEVIFISATDGGVYDAPENPGHKVTWNIGTVLAGATQACVEVTGQIAAGTSSGTTIINFATIDSDETGPTTIDESTEICPSACCLGDNTCVETTEDDCVNNLSGAFQGDQTACGGMEACCLPDESCVDVDAVCCENELSGTPQGTGTLCSEVDCSQCDPLAYSNVIDPITYFHMPGGFVPMADDLTLHGGPCEMASYELEVMGLRSRSFTVDVELRTGIDPCDPGTKISGSEKQFNCPSDGFPCVLTADFDPPIPIPGTVWMVVEFWSDQAGWIGAEEAERGQTEDVYYKIDPIDGCNPHNFGGDSWAGFWAQIWCDVCEDDGDCDDGDPCTVDECLECSCVNTEVDCTPYDDECNVASCDPDGPDGNCDIVTPRPNGTPCPDEYWCNGEETCLDGSCVFGTPPCPNPCCDESIDECVDIAIDPGSDCFQIDRYEAVFDFGQTPIPAWVFEAARPDLEFKPFDGTIFFGASDAWDYALKWDRLDMLTPCSGGTCELELKYHEGKTPVFLLGETRGFTVSQTSGVGIEFAGRMQLSAVPHPRGTLAATSEHVNGGTFTALFYLYPRLFVWPKRSPNNVVAVFDMGQQGWEALQVETVGPAHWVGSLSPAVSTQACAVDFIPGVWEDPVTGEQCCERFLMSGPGVHLELVAPDCSPFCDTGACCLPDELEICDQTLDQNACQLAGGQFQPDWTHCADADGDNLPDWQEKFGPWGKLDDCHVGTDPLNPDTDGDSCDDGEEYLAGWDPLNPCSFDEACVVIVDDCNANGVEDICDIQGATSEDCNSNRIPDDCEAGACCFKRLDGTPGCADLDPDVCLSLDHGTPLGPCVTCPPVDAQINAHFTQAQYLEHPVTPPTQCPDPSALLRGRDCPPGYVIDSWFSIAQDERRANIFCEDFQDTPIPGGFFGPNSDSFDGVICYEGVPLGSTPFGEFGDADTLIKRSGGPLGNGDPFDRCTLPASFPTGPVTSVIEIVALSLHSIVPITVTYNGGQNPEEWDVAVGLSEAHDQLEGTFDAVKEHCNGGTFTTVLPVRPRFVFTKVDPPATEQVLEGVDAGIDVTLQLPPLGDPDVSNWVHDVDPNSGAMIDVCSAVHPGLDDTEPTVACDCNDNLIRDKCDIEDCPPENVSCRDCNSNGVPDECDIPGSAGCPTGLCTADCAQDCNENCIPDECEWDCNGNGIPDECDISQGTSVDECTYTPGFGNDIPDECELDCNDNGIVDSCEIDHESSLDVDGNGILDMCLPATGACCFSDGSCLTMIEEVCTSLAGLYKVGESVCLGDDTNPPDGVDDACYCAAMPADLPVGCAGCWDCTLPDPDTCADGRVEGTELAGYTCAWKRFCHNDAFGVVRAAVIWRRTECYCREVTEDNWGEHSCPPPASRCCWDTGRGVGDNRRGGLAPAKPGAGTATAHVRALKTGGTPQVTVEIAIEPPEGTTAMVLEYDIPEDWQVRRLSDGGQYDQRQTKVRWGLFFDDQRRTVTLTATAGTARIRSHRSGEPVGTVWFDEFSIPIFGEWDRAVSAPKARQDIGPVLDR